MVKRPSWFAVFVVASLVPLAAGAHGPSRLKVDRSVEIDASADKVWARVGNFQDASWIPAVAKTEGSGGNAADEDHPATRHLTLKGEGSPTVDEQLVAYDAAGMSYRYKITQVDPKVLPVNNYASTITVVAEDGGKCKLEWKAGFYRGYPNNDPPPELNDDASQAAVEALYTSTLDAVKKSFEGGGK